MNTTHPTRPGSDVIAYVVVAVVAAVATLPFALARFVPGQDLPAHVETAAQILGLWRGQPSLTSLYVLHGQPWPNALPTLLLASLSSVVDGFTAAKAMTAVSAVAWPLSMALLLQRLRRPPLLALLLIPTSFDLSLGYGFLHFVVGKPLWALALVAAVDVARGATVARVARLALLLAALFATHLMLFATAVPLCGLVIVVVAEGWRPRLRGLTAPLLGSSPALWWALHQPKGAAGSTAFPTPASSLENLWSNLGDLHAGRSDGVAWIVCGLAALVVVVTNARAAHRRETVAIAVAAAGVLAFAFFGPLRVPGVSVVAERFFAPGFALLLAVPPLAALSRRSAAIVVVAGVVGSGALAVDLTQQWRAFSGEDMGDFDALLAKIPPGSRVATQYATPFSPHGAHNALWHWGKLAALRGSSTDDNFAWRATCVVGLREGVKPPLHPALTAAALAPWDFLLVRGETLRLNASLDALSMVELARTGSWRLFRVDHPNAPPMLPETPTTDPTTDPAASTLQPVHP